MNKLLKELAEVLERNKATIQVGFDEDGNHRLGLVITSCNETTFGLNESVLTPEKILGELNENY